MRKTSSDNHSSLNLLLLLLLLLTTTLKLHIAAIYTSITQTRFRGRRARRALAGFDGIDASGLLVQSSGDCAGGGVGNLVNVAGG